LDKAFEEFQSFFCLRFENVKAEALRFIETTEQDCLKAMGQPDCLKKSFKDCLREHFKQLRECLDFSKSLSGFHCINSCLKNTTSKGYFDMQRNLEQRIQLLHSSKLATESMAFKQAYFECAAFTVKAHLDEKIDIDGVTSAASENLHDAASNLTKLLEGGEGAQSDLCFPKIAKHLELFKDQNDDAVFRKEYWARRILSYLQQHLDNANASMQKATESSVTEVKEIKDAITNLRSSLEISKSALTLRDLETHYQKVFDSEKMFNDTCDLCSQTFEKLKGRFVRQVQIFLMFMQHAHFLLQCSLVFGSLRSD
jgi:hypothetical protein